MKKLFVFAAICALSISTVKADGFDRDRIITKEQLPATSQNFISEHFADSKIAYVKEDRDFISKNYEVKFSDGSKVEFSRDGAWKEVSCRSVEVPSAIVPDQIEKYIKENYEGARIIEIDRDRNDYEVRLSNRLELTFDLKFNIIDIDD